MEKEQGAYLTPKFLIYSKRKLFLEPALELVYILTRSPLRGLQKVSQPLKWHSICWSQIHIYIYYIYTYIYEDQHQSHNPWSCKRVQGKLDSLGMPFSVVSPTSIYVTPEHHKPNHHG